MDIGPKPYNRGSHLLPMYQHPFHGRLLLKHRQTKEHSKEETERHINLRKFIRSNDKPMQHSGAVKTGVPGVLLNKSLSPCTSICVSGEHHRIGIGLRSRFTQGRRQNIPQMPG
jgi:hypothetical protein